MFKDTERVDPTYMPTTHGSRTPQAERNIDVHEVPHDYAPSVDFEKITAADDVLQVVVSTTRSRIRGRDINTQIRASRILGAMSDISLQRLSEDRTRVMLNLGADGVAIESRQGVNTYGPGYTLGVGDRRL